MMRSNSGNEAALSAAGLANKVEELAKAASVIHQELGDSPAANVGVMIDGSVLKLACSRTLEQGYTQDVDAGRADVTSVNKQRHND
jgi:hypothetical protein